MDWNMSFIEQARLEDEADELEENIIKQYAKYNINIDITKWQFRGDRFVFKVKMKGNAREAHVRANAPDVQLRLKLSLFHVVRSNFNLYLIVSRNQPVYDHLPRILNTSSYQEAQKQIGLPYVVGYDVLGGVVLVDLAQFPHLLLGGSTSSGKTVGVQSLIASIAYSKSPSEVNFILIDVGAIDLMTFEGLPHLSHAVIRDRNMARQALSALLAEMERRIELEYADQDQYAALPRLVLVIDEFPALFLGLDDKERKSVVTIVSSLLQRGRHAKLHIVLAAQNPTVQNMKIDLGNITARIAFKCAKRNFSETILGEGGAESLLGHGDLLIRSPQFDSPQRVQGIYTVPEELQQIVRNIKARPYSAANKFSLTISNDNLTRSSHTLGSQLSCSMVRKGPSESDQLLASVIEWALSKDYISTNLLVREYHLGWNKAASLVSRLEELGIVDKLEGKSRRKVIPDSTEDIPEELLTFLEASGYTWNSVANAIYSR